MKNVLLIVFLTSFLGVTDSLCQSKKISGRLTNSSGDAIPGVHIAIKGTTIGTVTDTDGNYSIEAPVGSVLVFSSVGFGRREVKVTSDTGVAPNEGNLVENPPNGASTIASKFPEEPKATASLTSLSPGYAVINYSNYKNIREALSQPYNNYNFPYHVYDINYISPEETWEKYNIPSQNGYFLLDSRYSHWIGVRLDYSTSIAWNQPFRLPKLQNSFAQGSPGNGDLTWRGPETGEIFSWGPRMSHLEFDGSSYPYDRNGQLTSLGNGNGKRATHYDPYEFFKKGMTTTQAADLNLHFLQKWFLELGYHSHAETGIIPNSRNVADNFKFEIEKSGSSLLDFTYHFDHSKRDSRLTSRGGNLAGLFYAIATTPPSFDNQNGFSGKEAGENTAAFMTQDGQMRSYSPQRRANPYFTIGQNPNNDESGYFSHYTDLHLKLNAVNVKGKISYDNSFQQQSFGYFTPGIWDGLSTFSHRRLESQNMYSHISVSADTRPWNYKHRLSGFVIGEYTATNFDFERQNERFGELVSRVTHEADRKVYTVSEKVSYHFDNIFNIDLQNTSYLSNTLAENEYFNPFAGISVSTNDIPHWLDFISYAKFFSSFSTSVSELAINYNDLEFNTLGYTSTQFTEYYEYNELFYSSKLSPERSQKWELGSEVKLGQGAVEVGFSYYHYLRKNAIFPVFTGSQFELENGADLSSKGFDAYVSFYRRWNNFFWEFDINVSRNRSIVDKLYGNQTEIPIAGFSDIHKSLIEGQPVGVLVGTRYARNEEGKRIIGNDGYPIFDHQTGILGDPNPDWTSGIENSLRWRNLGLSFLIAIKSGGDIWNGTHNVLNYHGTSLLTAEQRTIRDYIFDGVNAEGQINNIPVNFADAGDNVNENRWVRYGLTGVAEDAIEDGSWIRMKEIGVHYTLPSHLIDQFYLTRVKISAFVTNLFLISNYKGVDPQTSMFGYSQTDGLDLFNIPSIRSYGFKLNVRL